MDEKLVIPNLLRPIILRSVHYGHPGRGSMLATVANVWWPRLHREVVGIAQTCQQCKTAGKNIKPLLRHRQIGKLPRCTEINQEIAIAFARPFQNAVGAKKYLLVSIHQYSGWPEAQFLRKTNNEKVIDFYKKCIARQGIPITISTDLAIIFRSQIFKEFCKEWYINHIECPIKDHRGNGK